MELSKTSKVKKNLVIYDTLNAHFAFLKERYEKYNRDVKIKRFSVLSDFIDNQHNTVILIFIYEKAMLFGLLSLLESDFRIVIFGHQKDILWIEDNLPSCTVVDMSLPKEELFTFLNDFIF